MDHTTETERLTTPFHAVDHLSASGIVPGAILETTEGKILGTVVTIEAIQGGGSVVYYTPTKERSRLRRFMRAVFGGES